jgi:hypothetical protein
MSAAILARADTALRRTPSASGPRGPVDSAIVLHEHPPRRIPSGAPAAPATDELQACGAQVGSRLLWSAAMQERTARCPGQPELEDHQPVQEEGAPDSRISLCGAGARARPLRAPARG